MKFPEILRGSVWHTTTPKRYESIIEKGSILPEPDLSDSERWGTAKGETHYPYVRSIGGVSLFDFRNFDEEQYSKRYPVSSWRAFVPCSHRSDEAIWIQINLQLVKENYISGEALLAEWKSSGELRRKIMPLIEAAHIGQISATAFGHVFIYKKNEDVFSNHELDSIKNA